MGELAAKQEPYLPNSDREMICSKSLTNHIVLADIDISANLLSFFFYQIKQPFCAVLNEK